MQDLNYLYVQLKLVILMEFKKAPDELVEFITEKMKKVNCESRKMFGYPSYFINGNMFAGLFGNNLLLKLSDADFVEIMKTEKNVKSFEPMPGRAMKGYVSLPKSVYSDADKFDCWLDKSVKYVSSLPFKRAKPKK